MIENMREELLKLLHKNAYRSGDFTLSSGKKSNHYVNAKTVTLSAEGLTMASHLMLELLDSDAVAVAGLTMGADPLVSGVAMASFDTDWARTVDAMIIRKTAKGYGMGAWIEGALPPEGSKVTALEDVVTTGGSVIKAVTRLRDVGYVVDRVVTLVDRQVDGEADEFMKSAGLKLYSVYNVEELAGVKNES